MIIRKKEHWFKMLFIWRGSVISQLIPRLSALLILSFLIVIFRETLYKYNIHLNPAPFTLFGIALALFLGFRNSVSYDRFWEGRKLWGSLITTSRNLTRQVHTLPTHRPNIPNTSLFINYLIATAYTLKHQLRNTDPSEDLDRLLPPSLAIRAKAARFKPHLIIREMGHWLQSARQNNHIDYIAQQSLDSNLNSLSEIIGGCERIAGTPIPYSYSVLLHRTVYVYCFLLPLGLVDSLGWMTPIIVVFIAYTYVALEAIADELENPFGLLPNDLALDTLCLTLENSLLELDNRPLRPDEPSADPLILT
jgi:putative membrane protein